MAIGAKRGQVQSTGRFGVTLLETLVVLGIIAVLVALLVPAVQKVRDAAHRAGCASNLRQLALAVHQYADARHRLPQGCEYPFLKSPEQLVKQIGMSWNTSILPYVEQNALWNLAWDAHRKDPSGNAPEHLAVLAQTVPVYLCPSESRQTSMAPDGRTVLGLTSYVGVAGTNRRYNDGVFHINYTVRLADITDGTSHTVMIGERPPGPYGVFGTWYAAWGDSVCPLSQILPTAEDVDLAIPPTSDCPYAGEPLRPGRLGDSCDTNHFWSLHVGGANFAFADGSVRFLRYSEAQVLPALATRAGGEVVEDDF
jgi:prepilin-type processing-associated H-X9-DG protein